MLLALDTAMRSRCVLCSCIFLILQVSLECSLWNRSAISCTNLWREAAFSQTMCHALAQVTCALCAAEALIVLVGGSHSARTPTKLQLEAVMSSQVSADAVHGSALQATPRKLSSSATHLAMHVQSSIHDSDLVATYVAVRTSVVESGACVNVKPHTQSWCVVLLYESLNKHKCADASKVHIQPCLQPFVPVHVALIGQCWI